jgi:Protein of unknown function (DUF2934)
METTAMPVKPSSGEIALLAFQIWEQEGKPQGRELDHWLQAETLLLAMVEPTEPKPAEVVTLSTPPKHKKGKRGGRVAVRMAA